MLLVLTNTFVSSGADSDGAELEEIQTLALPSLLSVSCVTASSDGRFLYAAAFNPSFSFAGMPSDFAEKSVRLFATEVLPEIKRWDAPPIPAG